MLGDGSIYHYINVNGISCAPLSKDTADDGHDFLNISTGIPLVKENDVCPPGVYGLECQTQCPMESSHNCDHVTGKYFIHIDIIELKYA